jgi:Putative adhesin
MKLKYLLISIALALCTANIASAAGKVVEDERRVEQTVAAEPNVIVSLCIASGSITVRGWERNEVQASSGDAETIELRRASANAAVPASRLEVLIADQADGPRTQAGSCSAFSDIELNVPRGAIVQLQTRDGDINVSDVAEARVETQNGDIDLERISRLVEAKCLSGDISLKDSTGRVVLGSVSGSVEASNVRSITAGDDFEAGTVSGDVVLDQISHAQVHAKSVSGSVNMTGPLAHGGRYDFKTMSGDVTLALPSDSSFKVNAKVAHGGEIISDFTITPTDDPARKERVSPVVAPSPNASPSGNPLPSPEPAPAPAPLPDPHGMERLNGIFGSGDATLNLASFSGTVHLRRR